MNKIGLFSLVFALDFADNFLLLDVPARDFSLQIADNKVG